MPIKKVPPVNFTATVTDSLGVSEPLMKRDSDKRIQPLVQAKNDAVANTLLVVTILDP